MNTNRQHLTTILLATVFGSVPLSAESDSSEKESFLPTWKSLDRYECPEWFHDAKFGIYAHWGPYSATMASANTDWYSTNMYVEGSVSNKYHVATYGTLDKFGYKDFIPLFTAEKFNADEWVDLYIEAGAKFAGPVGEHADGFAMWDSSITPWNAVKMGPKRDVVGEMEKAVRKRGLKFLVSMHHQWKWGWYPTSDKTTDASNPEYAELYGPAVPKSAFGKVDSKGKRDYMDVDPQPTKEFCEEWLGKVNEVVDQYHPDLLWFDNRMSILPERYRMEMAAHYYNQALEEDQQVVLTYKRPDMIYGSATSDLERARMPDTFPEPWLTDTSLARSSWAYAEDLEYYSADRLIDDLIDIVSKNGCMLLNIAPKPDGTIPEEQQEILRGMGKWLKLNGEAIYGSRPWLTYGEGPTVTPVGHLSDIGFHGFSSDDVRFTTQGQTLYAIALGWPESGKLSVKALGQGLSSDAIKGVTLIGHEGEIKWEQTVDALEINLPENAPCEYAYVFKLAR
ncbi:MAG: alpha-L-fucosidase [Akkermansiaceae bacterium]|jgi:alpha-L-fucosidase|nr:alpha-L-fucosidase [Akkermansiaceae bacterium]MDP4897134.1 alpha-L-fucosidase [Akkermansiaceae bacterium]